MDPHALPHREPSGYVEYINQGNARGHASSATRILLLGLGKMPPKTKVMNVTKGTFYSLSFVFLDLCAQEERAQCQYHLILNQKTGNAALCRPCIAVMVGILTHGVSWLRPRGRKVRDADHFTVPEGKRAIELVAGRESAIAQQVITKSGKIYDLIFSLGDANNSCEGSMLVEAFGRESCITSSLCVQRQRGRNEAGREREGLMIAEVVEGRVDQRQTFGGIPAWYKRLR
ncbi:hypothetical protein HAX54_037005 [Datura stramonium]|uniref:DUF642 domain-containing protein n=1 Tax=Datura stramonium TaxID=4076 RepID=A0ABS8VJ30_DATST|nr:hypothetical protein [Datura stramonium]